jgi:O-antigen/teichoic acid export membrane protein
MFTAVAGYVFKIYLARTLGSEALGIYALGMTVAGLFGVFGGLGINWAALRFPPEYASTGRWAELRAFMISGLLILGAVNGLLASGVVLARRWVALRLYHTPALSGYLYLFALILFMGSLTNFFGQVLTGFKATATRTIITNFTGVLLNIVFAVLLISAGTGLWGYIVAQLASAAVVLALLVWATSRRLPAAGRGGTEKIVDPQRGMFSFAAAAFAMDLMGFLYAQTDKVILGSYMNARTVGIYSVAATIVAFVSIALQSVNPIFSPTIAELHARGQFDLLNRLFQSLTKWVVGLTLPLAAVVIIFSRVLMRVFGPDFEVGWVILVIGTVGQLVNCGTGSVGYLLLMSGNEKRLVRIQAVMALVSVLSCLVLVSRFGITGAAIATAACNVTTNIWCLMQVKKVLGLFPFNRSYWILAAPSVVTIALVLGLRIGLRSVRADIPVVVFSTAVAYVVFLATLLLIGLKEEDRMIATAVWVRIRGSLPVLPGSQS